MFEGKTKAAICLLTEEAKGGVLHLSDHVDTNRTVREVLIDTHPSGQPAHPVALTEDHPPEVHPVSFKLIDVSMIRLAALRTTGAAGPSGLMLLAGEDYAHRSNLPLMACYHCSASVYKFC